MGMILAIALGGGIGATTRHYVIALVNGFMGGDFPYGTMACNIIGSFIIGFLMEMMALKWHVSLETRAFLVTGFLGGLTTFSSFSFDIFKLTSTDQYIGALLYMIGSVSISFTVLLGAVMIVRRMYP